MLTLSSKFRFGLLSLLLGFASQDILAKELPVMVGIGGPFEAVDTQSQVFTEENLKGKTALLAFGYTNCADVCPVTVGYMRNVYNRLTPAEQSQVQFVFITVDPETDTPEFLDEYLDYFNKDFIGLTGTRAQVDTLVDNYKVDYQRLADGGVPADLIRRIDKIGKAEDSRQKAKLRNPYTSIPDWESKTVAELHATGHNMPAATDGKAADMGDHSGHDMTAGTTMDDHGAHKMTTDKDDHADHQMAAAMDDHSGHNMVTAEGEKARLYSHSAHLFVLDRDAQTRGLAHTGTPQLDLVADLRSLINE